MIVFGAICFILLQQAFSQCLPPASTFNLSLPLGQFLPSYPSMDSPDLPSLLSSTISASLSSALPSLLDATLPTVFTSALDAMGPLLAYNSRITNVDCTLPCKPSTTRLSCNPPASCVSCNNPAPSCVYCNSPPYVSYKVPSYVTSNPHQAVVGPTSYVLNSPPPNCVTPAAYSVYYGC
ncbi:unnamed protein product [Pieris brassicae]|uniref:Uncharacterized protein n=1 Tax=Pieris brassicae TaxID=7116 RepID=A0A9P0XF27_PIEBR|nr:unnamed protein product [Pieris brassicae]